MRYPHIYQLLDSAESLGLHTKQFRQNIEQGDYPISVLAKSIRWLHTYVKKQLLKA